MHVYILTNYSKKLDFYFQVGIEMSVYQACLHATCIRPTFP